MGQTLDPWQCQSRWVKNSGNVPHLERLLPSPSSLPHAGRQGDLSHTGAVHFVSIQNRQQRGIFGCNTSVIFYPQSQNFQSNSNPKTNTTPNTIILCCELVMALRNPILELSLGGNGVNSCCGKQARKGEQIHNHGGWGHLKEAVMVDRY